GRLLLSIATAASSGSMIGPGSARAASSQASVGLSSVMRFRAESKASSHSEIAAIRSNPAPRAALMRLRASPVNSWLPASSQTQTCVSSKSKRGSDIVGIAGPFVLIDWTDNVAANFYRAGHPPENVDRLVVDRHELGDWLAALGDDERLPPLC